MTATASHEPPGSAATRRRIIVMIGAPGAGKGTQASRLAAALGLPHVSTGKLFREALSGGSALGERIRPYLEAGTLVPDEVTVAMLDERIRQGDAAAGAIIDGFPRTRAQAVALDAILATSGEVVTAALFVEVSIDELLDRLTGRRICSLDDQHVYHLTERPPRQPGICDIDGADLRQRSDDRVETVRSRLDTQLPPMYEVIDHYADAGVLFVVRGDRPVETVTEDLLDALAGASRSR